MGPPPFHERIYTRPAALTHFQGMTQAQQAQVERAVTHFETGDHDRLMFGTAEFPYEFECDHGTLSENTLLVVAHCEVYVAFWIAESNRVPKLAIYDVGTLDEISDHNEALLEKYQQDSLH